MASKTPQSRARRTLTWLAAIIVGLGVILGIGVATNNTSGVPLLALDLEGGTQMVLSPETSTGEAVTPEQMSQAVEIIRQRVDGSGVSEAEINTQGDNNVVVSMLVLPMSKLENSFRLLPIWSSARLLPLGRLQPRRKTNVKMSQRYSNPMQNPRMDPTRIGSLQKSTMNFSKRTVLHQTPTKYAIIYRRTKL